MPVSAAEEGGFPRSLLSEDLLRDYVDLLVRLVEAVGALVIFVGAVLAAVGFVRAALRRNSDREAPTTTAPQPAAHCFERHSSKLASSA